MPPASKQFEEHNASGTFVRPSVRPSGGGGGSRGEGVAGEGYFLYEALGFAAGIGIFFMPPASKKL